MPETFTRTLRSLEDDGSRASLLALGVVVLFAGGGSVWLWAARVGVLAQSIHARIETEAPPFAIDAPASGRVVTSHLAPGRAVAIGDALVELDTAELRIRLEKERTKEDATSREVEALVQQLAAREEILSSTSGSAIDEARANERDARAAAELATDEVERSRPLVTAGQVAPSEMARSQTEARRRSAQAEAHAHAVKRLVEERRREQSERRAQAMDARGNLARAQALHASAKSDVQTLEAQIAQRQVHSPVAGTLGEVKQLGSGAIVAFGERLAVVIPRGQVRIVAEFAPADAVGRIRPGQPGWLRLDGFPWTQFGTVAGLVTGVSSELRDGQVRIELDVAVDPSGRIPLQHGLPGTLEIEVDRVSPATLVLRAAGQWVARAGEAHEAESRIEGAR